MPCDGFMVRIAFAPLWGALVGRYRPQHVFADHGVIGLFSGTPQQIYRFFPRAIGSQQQGYSQPVQCSRFLRASIKSGGLQRFRSFRRDAASIVVRRSVRSLTSSARSRSVDCPLARAKREEEEGGGRRRFERSSWEGQARIIRD